MSLLTALRAGIKVADKITKPLQCQVGHEAYLTQRSGERVYAIRVDHPAIVDWKQKSVKTPSGDLSLSNATIMFLDPEVKVVVDDVLTLPDGMTGPIMALGGFADAKLGLPMLREVYI